MPIPLSILDLATVCEGATAADAFRNSLALAQRAESLGLERYWLAEHHSLPSVASSATAVVIGHVAAGTAKIRVGAGGIMLPNHAPLIIAEQFGTLASLFPDRIDLGLGRAPGSDGVTQRALRRDSNSAARFVDDVRELMFWFQPPEPGQPVFAMPGAGLDVPLWILGSSTFGAEVAAALGLPYAFASHFAPAALQDAMRAYREGFRPSPKRSRPHLMLAANVVAADSDADALHLFTSIQHAFIRLRTGNPGPFPPPRPVELPPAARALLDGVLSCSVVGSLATVRAGLRAFLDRYQPDELMITVPVFDQATRLRSLELTAEAWAAL
jgi:luciferase family oxidoreductase group 1